jgi:hypothetical protein
MIPKFRIPNIQEYMVGYIVGDFTAESDTMNVFIPVIMMDKQPSTSSSTIPVISALFVSRENIAVSSTVSDNNYIKVKVSDLFKRHYREIIFASGATITYKYDDFKDGTKVKVYIPDLNLDDAILVPLL